MLCSCVKRIQLAIGMLESRPMFDRGSFAVVTLPKVGTYEVPVILAV